jgi:hypothetical protein
VIISNDLGADPDGLFAFVHQVLSPSTEVPLVVGAHALLPTDPFDQGKQEADDACAAAVQMLELMGKSRSIKAYAGSNTGLPDAKTPIVTDGARAIVAEAMRTDTSLPLYLTAGGSLTDFASAYLMEPAIAGQATLIWIGGAPYPADGHEYNLAADPIAAQVLFNDSTMPIWQVPSDVYSMCMDAERFVAERRDERRVKGHDFSVSADLDAPPRLADGIGCSGLIVHDEGDSRVSLDVAELLAPGQRRAADVDGCGSVVHPEGHGGGSAALHLARWSPGVPADARPSMCTRHQ